MRVFYIPTGGGFPYNPGIEEFVVRALEAVTPDLRLADPQLPLLDQVVAFRPDVVLVLNGFQVDATTLDAIRGMGFRVALWAVEDPYYSDITLANALTYDYVFTIESNCVDLYRAAGCRRVLHLPLGVDPDVYHPGPAPPAYESDVCLVGVGFGNRVALVDELTDYLLTKRVAIVGYWWDRLPRFGEIRHMIRNEAVPPEEARRYYAGAKIVLNVHRRYDDDSLNVNRRRVAAHSPNNRTFEINACRTLQITDERPDLGLYYTPGRDLVVFRNATDLREQIEFYLRDDDRRREIAENGYRKTAGHTYRDRLARILDVVAE